MGCCASSDANKIPVVAEPRRRLSLGFVDEQIATKVADREEDRSLLVELAKQSILDIIESTPVSGKRRQSWTVGSETDSEKHRCQSFAQKTIKEIACNDNDGLKPHTDFIGYACKKGLKPEAPNQDSFFVVRIGSEVSIYGVFDGHGPAGHDVSDFVKNELPKVLIMEHDFEYDPEKALINAFEKIQRLLEQATELGQLSAQFSGTTGSVVMHMHETSEIYIAHVGDSRCVLGRKMHLTAVSPQAKTQTAKANHLTAVKTDGGTNGNGCPGFVAVDLTQDHKPDDPQERLRIEEKGGRVVFDGYYNYRVYAKSGRYPGLNMSRAMGDLAGYYDAGISPIPDVKNLSICTTEPADVERGVDKFLLLCSDGVWEFLSSQECVDICSQFQQHQAQACAETLAKESWDRWNTHMLGQVVDDITAIVVYL